MSKIFDGLLNVYAFAWVLITRSAFGMYACVALMALMLGLFVISFAEQLRLAKKKKESPPAVFEELPKSEVEEEKPKPKPKRIYPHYDDVEVVEYKQPAEGSLREENREDGWLHVFVWRAGNWEKTHRISPEGVKEKCHSSRKSQITANRCVIALPLLGVVGMFAEDIIALTRSNIKMKEGWKIHCKYEPKRQQK